MSVWGDILNAIDGKDVSDVAAVAQALTSFFGTVTDPKMWMSLGWLLLGAICLFWGLMLLLRIPQFAGRTALQAGSAAAKAKI